MLKRINFPSSRNIILENYIGIPHLIKNFKALKFVDQIFSLLNKTFRVGRGNYNENLDLNKL
jgi:hypothetical protein